MNTNQTPLTRRRFLQTSALLGAGAMLLPSAGWAAEPAPSIPRRKFGRTGVELPVLGLGCMFDIVRNSVILRQAADNGITYWDTAAGYHNSEPGIGSFFEKNSAARKQIFLVTKASGARDTDDMTKRLEQSLERLKTDYVDLYFLHGKDDISDVDQPEIKAWAEAAKKSGKIRFFGFSTHSNVESCLSSAAKLGWIDGMMFTYNYRVMDKPELKAAIDACYAAGVGLTAMKTQGERQGAETPAQAALLSALTGGGFTAGQAKLKVVMDNPQISVACVQMPNLNVFRQNLAAALSPTPLSTAQRAALQRHAAATHNSYCAGCSRLCESAVAGAAPIREVLRYMMYHEHYAEVDARAMFAELAPEARAALPTIDYSAAERACPRQLPIGDLMREAASRLA
jgi:predicted aldo/keto reductase-like oxidoreductase